MQAFLLSNKKSL